MLPYNIMHGFISLGTASSPVGVKLLWLFPVERAVVEHTDGHYDGNSFGDGHSIDHCGLLTVTVTPVQSGY